MADRITDRDDGAPGSRQLLTFQLGEELYGIGILQVQEIRGWSPVTRIPQSPEHVLGVLNLRGSMVSIIDLRARLGLGRTEITPLTVVIILSVMVAGKRRDCGLLVDRVSDVVDVTPGSLRAPPTLDGTDVGYVQGLAMLAERMLVLLDAERILATELADTNLDLAA